MVQVLSNPNAQKFSSLIAGNLGQGLGQGLNMGVESARLMKQQALRDQQEQMAAKQQLAQKMGLLEHEYGLKSQLQGEKLKGELDQTEKTYPSIEKTFGKEIADVWQSLSPGSQTQFLKKLFDYAEREQSTEGFLDTLKSLDNKKTVEQIEKPKDGETPQYSLDLKGMNAADKIKYKTQLREQNFPIWKEAVDKNKNYKELSRDINILKNLNNKKNLPEGFSKLLINPETGAPWELATAVKDMHPDVQQWVKTIARQATQARSAFPGRVTNFDLQSYMRQFPNLFNTFEGRQVILDQMDLVNEGNKLFEDALIKVYKKNKLSGITSEDAMDLAESMVGDKLEKINSKIENLSFRGENLAEKDFDRESGVMQVYDSSGKLVGTIDISDVENLPEGFTVK